MGWSAQDIEKLRKKNDGQKSTAGSTGNSAGNSSTHSVPAPSAGGGSQSGGWSAEKIDAMRANSGVKATAKNGTDAWVNRSAGTSVRSAGNSSTHSFPQGGSLGAEVLKQMNGVTGTPAKTGSSKLQLAVPQEKKAADTKAQPGLAKTAETSVQRGGKAQPEWLTKPQPKKPAAQKATAPAATVRGTVKPTADQRAQARRNGNEGILAKGAQALKDHAEKAEAEDKFSDFTRLNQWMDADPKHRELVDLMRMTGNQLENATGIRETSWATQDTGGKTPKYTDADLLKKGYSTDEIKEARQYIAEYDALPTWEKAARRTADSWKGIGGAVASFIPQLGENLGMAIWNIEKSANNRKALAAEVEKNPREKNLYDRLMETDMDYRPKYSTGDLLQQGFTRQEIENMRARIAGTEEKDSLDPDESVGYQLSDYGRKHTERAQAGMSESAKLAMGIVTSAAENLAVAGISPALVLPVLSAQGGAESMGQSIEKGDSAGKTLAGGLAKFGAGWAINSVGAADLAKTMGSDYAKDTLAGKLADVVRSVADNGVLAQQYPTIANTISGGVDNAMQAFVETYADMAIDVALGDADAAANLYKPETFLQALESGLTGGASGALGGAVGTQLGKMRAAMEETPSVRPTADAARPDSSLGEGALGTAEQQAAANGRQAGNAAQQQEDAAVLQQEAVPAANEAAAEQTAVNDDPAVHTPAQNASIEEYKQSVDPGLAEYVDRVRAGEDLAPYTVTETSDRMRDAMQQLTGLDKVGKVTLMDANAVQHITNRHAGGDGSADGTMKNSADVARAAYVLNNFDNAYLAKDRAKGYKDSRGKRAPIVIFEKKIDGSHIIVEAVCDTKKGQNFIVSEYLSSVGVDQNEVVKALQAPMDAASDPRHTSETFSAHSFTTTESVQSPMDAASDPRDTSETLAAHSSADTTVSQRAGDVNGKSVENAGETVESQTVQQTEPAAMRETAGLEVRSEGAQKSSVQRELQRWKVSEGAAKTLSRNMPAGIADESRYAAAASSLYRLGQMEDVTTFDKAMELAKGMNGLAVNTEYVLAQPGGEAALKVAWLQGKGEAEAGALQAGTPGGVLSEKSTSGSGRVLYKGTMRTADEVATKLIELNARATDTDAVLKAVLEGDERVRAYVDTATGQIFFADSAGDVFGTVLHEDWHWYNALDAEGAKALQQHVLEYLAKSEGFENIDELIRAKLADYAQQNLTYGEAAEELVADAWRGIFDSEESFKRWVEFQRGQAEKNAGRAGAIRKVMNAVKDLLNDIVSRAKEVLAKDPENRAALKAQRLAEAEKRALQEEYFAHAEKAMENLRAAKENAAALSNEGAAKERRFKLHEGEDSLTEQINKHLDELEEMSPVATIRGDEAAFGKSIKENIDNIDKYFDSIGNKVERKNFGIVELTHYGANQTVRHGNSAAKQAAVAAVPEVIKSGKQIGYKNNWQGRGYDTFVFAAPVIVDGTRINAAVIVNSYIRENGRKAFYTHEVCWTDGSYVKFDDAGKLTKKEDTPTHLPMDVRSTHASAQEVSSDTTIAQNDAPVKKNVRMQIAEADEVEKLRTEQQALSEQQKALSEQQKALKEERTAWLESAEVKAVEAKKKALGNFSAQAKAYRESEEYQSYIAKRKDYNSRLAQLEEQSAALGDRMREAGERLQARANAKVNERQLAYNTEAEKHGGRAEYRRQLAKERFGVTEDFKKAGYILPDGKMLNFAQSERTRDTDHRAIREVFGPAEVKTGTEALNEFLLDGNVRVMAEGPGIDLSADTEPTAQQMEQIRKMVDELSGERAGSDGGGARCHPPDDGKRLRQRLGRGKAGNGHGDLGRIPGTAGHCQRKERGAAGRVCRKAERDEHGGAEAGRAAAGGSEPCSGKAVGKRPAEDAAALHRHGGQSTGRLPGSRNEAAGRAGRKGNEAGAAGSHAAGSRARPGTGKSGHCEGKERTAAGADAGEPGQGQHPAGDEIQVFAHGRKVVVLPAAADGNRLFPAVSEWR